MDKEVTKVIGERKGERKGRKIKKTHAIDSQNVVDRAVQRLIEK
jgi:hypothetical protein